MDVFEKLRLGGAIPAHPLALDRNRRLDEQRQRALTRYYLAAGCAGVAVGVHTTQFAIRQAGLLRPVLEIARQETPADRLAIAGALSVEEAELAASLRYDCVLVRSTSLDTIRAIATVLPVMGFYLQPAAGGSVLPYSWWRRLVEIPNVAAIKIAPFHRYQTFDVLRAAAGSGIALYTGNDDAIVWDLRSDWCVGGLLGHFAVWTRTAAAMAAEPERFDPWETTDANAAFFDAANGFAGCIAGIHEVLRRQGLLEGIWCLDPGEGLSPGQSAEIDRVCAAYPHLTDDAFVEAHRDEWLR